MCLKTSPHMCLCKDNPLSAVREQQLMLYQALLICLKIKLRASSALGNLNPTTGSFYHFKWIFKGFHYQLSFPLCSGQSPLISFVFITFLQRKKRRILTQIFFLFGYCHFMPGCFFKILQTAVTLQRHGVTLLAS